MTTRPLPSLLPAMLAALLALLFAHALPATAQSWPQRPVKFIVPVAAGTATDLTARVFADRLSPLWGQPIVVENRPGADGLIAVNGFVSARDDHALLFAFSTTVSLNPLIHDRLAYDPDRDLTPIAATAEVVFAVATHASTGARSLADLVTLAKNSPGRLNWAAAPGLPRYVFEGFRRAQGLDMAYVSYAQTGAAVQDLGEGRIDVLIATIATAMPAVESGKARLLAVTSRDRAALTPDVPSALEAGHQALTISALGCVFGWRDMSTSLRDRLAGDIDAVARDADVVRRLARIGQTVRNSTPASLAALLAEQRTTLAPIAKTLATKTAH